MKLRLPFAVVFATLILSIPLYHASDIKAETADIPSFHAYIEYSFQGYLVKGTFTEFTPDITNIRPLCSLDGKTYHSCGVEWELDSKKTAHLENQICLYHSYEPLKNYLEGEIDRFYIKLRLTYKDGTTLATKPAVIDRGTIQPLPEDLNPIATFPSSMSVRKIQPFVCYGKYQITVNADTTPEEISAYLPKTLPIEIQLQKGNEHFTEGTIECAITWKPLSLPSLSAGESITIADAAEQIVVPAGSVLKTPLGIFQLKKPLGIDGYGLSDDIELVVNVTAEDGNPTGALTMENSGLELAFEKKPTGATAVRAYTLTENETKWTELPNLPLLKAINMQPATANSGYTLVLKNEQEPLRSYLDAKEAGDTPTPFIIGLKIEGGVYDGKQLLLTWPDTYHPPLQLPALGGAGGNENNAGAANKEDSTTAGQRPTLPEDTEKQPENTPTAPSAHTSGDISGHNSDSEKQPDKRKENLPDKLTGAILPPIFTKTSIQSKTSSRTRTPMPTPERSSRHPNISPAPEAETTPQTSRSAAATPAETTSAPARIKRAGTALPAAPMTGGIGINSIGIVCMCIAGIGIVALTVRKRFGKRPDKANEQL